MTTIRIPPLASGGTETGLADSVVSVRLVDARGRPMIGLRTTDGAPVTAYSAHTVLADGEPLEVDLTPQSAIARADGAASYYQVIVRAPHRAEVWRIQVPDSAEVLELADLVAGAAVDPASLLASRLLPASANDGDVLAWSDEVGAWVSSQPAEPSKQRWIDLQGPVTYMPLQGQSGDPDRAIDGSLLFDASSVEQIAQIYQLPHGLVAGVAHPHLHWMKTTDDAGDVIWEMRYRTWNIGEVKSAWSDWGTPAGRVGTLSSDQRELLDFWTVDISSLDESSHINCEFRRAATSGSDTYAADAALWSADAHVLIDDLGSASI